MGIAVSHSRQHRAHILFKEEGMTGMNGKPIQAGNIYKSTGIGAEIVLQPPTEESKKFATHTNTHHYSPSLKSNSN